MATPSAGKKVRISVGVHTYRLPHPMMGRCAAS